MKYHFLIITTLLLVNSCREQSSPENAIIRFETSPSWHENLTVELNTENQELTFMKPNTWFYRKTGEKQKVFYELDSTAKEIARQLRLRDIGG